MPKPKIAIVYYSMYGHVRTLALAEKEGLEAAGCELCGNQNFATNSC